MSEPTLQEAAESVIVDPDIRGGMPVLRGTRVGVYEIADMAKFTDCVELLEDYPTLTRGMIACARVYAKAYPIAR